MNTIPGNTIQFGYGENARILGHCIIRDYLVMIMTSTAVSGSLFIYRSDLSQDVLGQPTEIYSSSDANMSMGNPIFNNTVGIYERADLIKVYWADGRNLLRSVNIMETGQTQDIEYLNMTRNVFFSTPVLETISAGGLYSGKVQYAYQLYSLNGAETIFSPASPLYDVFSVTTTSAIDRDFKGDAKLDDDGNRINTGKAFRIKIPVVDVDYDFIRVIAIQYSDVDATPDIRVLGSYPVSPIVYFTDSGEAPLGTLTLEEYRTLGGEVFSPGTIATKDNMLIAANIEYQYFDVDFDCRAYRYKANGQGGPGFQTFVYSNDASVLNIDQVGSWPSASVYQGGTTTPINEGHDVICPYNWYAPDGIPNPESRTYSDTNGNNHKYQSSTLPGPFPTMGGEGENIRYRFSYDESELRYANPNPRYNDVLSDNNEIDFPSYKRAYTNLFKAAHRQGYRRDEIYPFAVVFHNAKGQTSFVKWIGDIKFPAPQQISVAYEIDGTTTAQNLFIQIELNTLNLPSDVTGFQIVRAKREEADKTIACSGLVSATTHGQIHTDYGDDNIYYCNFLWPTFQQEGSLPRDPRRFSFISPEIIYYKDLVFSATDYLQYGANLGHRHWYGRDRGDRFSGEHYDSHPTFEQVQGANNRDGHIFVGYRKCSGGAIPSPPTYDLIDMRIFGPVDRVNIPTSAIEMRGVDFVNYSVNVGTNYLNQGPSGTRAILATTSENIVVQDDGDLIPRDVVYGMYKRKNVDTIYGGQTYSDRQNREYIPCNVRYNGEWHSVINIADYSGGYIDVYGGDTYVAMFEYLWTIASADDVDGDDIPDISQHDRFFCKVQFPVETSINVKLDNGTVFSEIKTDDLPCLRETAGEHYTDELWWFDNDPDGVRPRNIPEHTFIQEKDMYLYNSVYSQQDTSKIFISKPAAWVDLSRADNRVIRSDVKSANEESDSFLIFRALNNIDVDSGYGSITNLLRYKNYVIFFQEHGVGTISVNERQLIPVENNAALELGRGGILDRFDMISTGIGTQHGESVVATENGFYWFDESRREFWRFSGQLQNLSMVRGMNSFFKILEDSMKNANVVTDGYGVMTGYNFKFGEIDIVLRDASNNYKLVYNELTDSFTHFQSGGSQYLLTGHKRYLSTNNLRQMYENNIHANFGYFYGGNYNATIEYLINPNGNIVNTYHNFEITTEVWNGSVNELDSTWSKVRITNDYQDSTETDLVIGTNIRRRLRTWRMHIPRDSSARIRDTYMKAEFTFVNQGPYRFVVHDLVTTYTVPAEMFIK
jgi:hypothetical protein